MVAVAFIAHTMRPKAVALVLETATWLEEQGHSVRVPADGAAEAGLGRWAASPEDLVAGLDLAVSLGGDGTMLRTLHLVCDAEVPVLGVNVGHLGYLTEVEPVNMRSAIEGWLAGRHSVEPRMTLELTVRRAEGPPVSHSAINEAVLQRTAAGHTVRVATCVDGNDFVTYSADGLIVATPTGSTAYNLSARGPIVSPRQRALILTAVSPHMLFNLPLVLDDSQVVRLDVLDGRPADLVVDGQPVATLSDGDSVTCVPGAHDALLVSYARRDFLSIVKAKFGLPER
ncbi:MAG: kinase [Acidimicrobiaceae bacterium]|nr:kinase [Acidimicrobiaceae bacterium]